MTMHRSPPKALIYFESTAESTRTARRATSDGAYSSFIEKGNTVPHHETVLCSQEHGSLPDAELDARHEHNVFP